MQVRKGDHVKVGVIHTDRNGDPTGVITYRYGRVVANMGKTVVYRALGHRIGNRVTEPVLIESVLCSSR